MRLVAVLGCVLSITLPASTAMAAFNPLDTTCNTAGASGSAICNKSVNGSDPITGTNGVLYKTAKLLAITASISAIIVIIVAGLMYITANGDPKKAETAQRAILGATIGLIIIGSAGVIVTLVINRIE